MEKVENGERLGRFRQNSPKPVRWIRQCLVSVGLVVSNVSGSGSVRVCGSGSESVSGKE